MHISEHLNMQYSSFKIALNLDDFKKMHINPL